MVSGYTGWCVEITPYNYNSMMRIYEWRLNWGDGYMCYVMILCLMIYEVNYARKY